MAPPPCAPALLAPGAAPATVLVTGATGRIGFPIARALAALPQHTVFGLARCARPGDEAMLRAAGVEPLVADVAGFDPVAGLPPGLTHVFHAAARTGRHAAGDWRPSFDVNVQATARLLAACRGVRGFVHCSSGSAYAYQGGRPLREDDPPGVHLGVYSLSKIAAEQVVQFVSAEHRIPVTVIRIFSAYGPRGGAPADRLARIVAGRAVVLHPDAPNRYHPVHEDDYVRLGVRALEVAATPPTVVNWAGSETVSAEDYCAFLADLVGRPLTVRYDPAAPWPLWPDVTRMHEVLGATVVPWRDGMARMAAALFPDEVGA